MPLLKTIRKVFFKCLENIFNKKINIMFFFSGQYVLGKKKYIDYEFQALVKVPCKFKLQKYPFGKQECILNFAIDNTEDKLSNTQMVPTSLDGFNTSNKIEYYGSKDLNEYDFIKADYQLSDSNFSVSITIHLQSLFGYHILNSFTPSILIFLISYVTFFFPISSFNERIMVSLTAVLVLAALSAQVTNSSVHTSYLKLLDVWYTLMLVFCFIVVMANTLINAVHEYSLNNTTKLHNGACNGNFLKSNFYQASVCNFWAKITVILLFIFYLIIFILLATELI